MKLILLQDKARKVIKMVEDKLGKGNKDRRELVSHFWKNWKIKNNRVESGDESHRKIILVWTKENSKKYFKEALATLVTIMNKSVFVQKLCAPTYYVHKHQKLCWLFPKCQVLAYNIFQINRLIFDL